jgi:hypothetical protein
VKNTFLLLIAFFAFTAGLGLHHANSAADRAPGFGQSQQAADEGSAARIARIETACFPQLSSRAKRFAQ